MTSSTDTLSRKIFLMVLLLIAFGIVFVYSSSFPVGEVRFGDPLFFVKRHVFRVVLGLGGLVFFSRLDYRVLGKISPILYGFGIILLIAALFAPEINGARRWVTMAGQRVQVSEIARIALVITLASKISKQEEGALSQWKTIGGYLVQIGAVVGLIVIEPDYSTSMLLVVITLSMLLAGGLQWRKLLPMLLLGGSAAFAYGISAPYRRNRILGFLNPDEFGSSLAYQTNHGLMALGNGQIFGTGLGASEQKYGFLPEAHTDFVFSILGEEIGFIGMTLLTIAFYYLIYLGFQVSKNAKDSFGRLLALGITMVVASYFLLHSFVNLRLFPPTGVPLPFISYGGMSLIFTASSLGILMSISRQTSLAEKVER